MVTRPLKLESQCIDSNCRVEKMSRRCKKLIKCYWIFRSCHERLGNLPLCLCTAVLTHIYFLTRKAWLIGCYSQHPIQEIFIFWMRGCSPKGKGSAPIHLSLNLWRFHSSFCLINDASILRFKGLGGLEIKRSVHSYSLLSHFEEFLCGLRKWFKIYLKKHELNFSYRKDSYSLFILTF